MATATPVVRAASAVLVHSPGLVRYGSKPSREIASRPSRLEELNRSLRSYDQAAGYLPNLVFLGKERPEKLFEVERPWFDRLHKTADEQAGFGDLIEEKLFTALLAVADPFKHVSLLERFWDDTAPLLKGSSLHGALIRATPSLISRDQLRSEIEKGKGLPLFADAGVEPVGWVRHGHAEDNALTAQVLLENLCCKVSAALAVRALLAWNDHLKAEEVDFVLSSSEEAVGDRYQRGGGNLAKAIAEFAGCSLASGLDIKNFCAGPIPAVVTAAALVQSGVFENVLVVGGSCLPKLGMKFLYHLEKRLPVLEDTQAAVAVWIGKDDGRSPRVNLAGVGRHMVRSGAGLDRQLRDIVLEPLRRLELEVDSVDRFIAELHNPEITIPANSGDIAERNYRMLAAVLASSGMIPKSEIGGFMRRKGVHGYAPTQGHIASAFAYVPHAVRELSAGKKRNCFLFSRASLFLGQMTELTDGMSVLLERHS